MKTLVSPVSLNSLNVDHVREFSKECKEPSWVLELRLKAFELYAQLPWPGKNDEHWKRTDLKLLNWEKLQWSPSAQPSKETIVRADNVEILTLEEAIQKKADDVRLLWSRAIENSTANKFKLLSLALGNSGNCIFTMKNKVVSAPIRRALSSNDKDAALFPLNFIVVEAGSEVQIWDDFGGEGASQSSYVSNFTGIHLKENSHASYYSLQHWDSPVNQLQFHEIAQDASSRWNSVAVAIGGHIFHNESVIYLNGQGAENKVLGVLFGSEKQNFENWVTQNHRAKKTTSDIQYRGALNGSAKSFFSGMVSIVKEAQQSDAYQSSKALLLSTDARADAIPNLEILADDVKCSHGAAVGPVDQDQMFYLKTRGVSEDVAERMIVEGFFEPVIAEIPSEQVQEQLRQFIEKKLAS